MSDIKDNLEHQALEEAVDILVEENAALRAQLEQFKWRDIASAPKDGTVIQVFIPSRNRVVEAWYCEETGLWPAPDNAYNDDGEPCNVGLPTKWMPTPKPPEEI